jgi:hypothetical protein
MYECPTCLLDWYFVFGLFVQMTKGVNEKSVNAQLTAELERGMRKEKREKRRHFSRTIAQQRAL